MGGDDRVMHLLVLAGCLGALWLSHRFHDAYVHAVSREERSWFQRVGLVSPKSRRKHIGHRLFLVFDLVMVAGAVAAWSYLKDQAGDGLVPLMLACEEWAVLILAWMFLEGRHLESFYQRLARATRGLGKARREAWRDPFAPPARRILLWCALGWASLPALLSLAGVGLLHASIPTTATAFAVFFVLPLAVVAAVIARALWPVRQLAYPRVD